MPQGRDPAKSNDLRALDLTDLLGRRPVDLDTRAISEGINGKVVLVTAHGNSLRALVKHLERIGDDDIAGLNIPTGMPLVYELGDDFMPTKPGAYLDPEAAAAAAEAVANQGKK